MMRILESGTKKHECSSIYPFVEQIRFLQSSSAMYRGRCTISCTEMKVLKVGICTEMKVLNIEEEGINQNNVSPLTPFNSSMRLSVSRILRLRACKQLKINRI